MTVSIAVNFKIILLLLLVVYCVHEECWHKVILGDERVHPKTSQNVLILHTKCSCKSYNNIKLMKGKALRKHSLHEKTAWKLMLQIFAVTN